jgi:biopolymer transport protein ExbD
MRRIDGIDGEKRIGGRAGQRRLPRRAAVDAPAQPVGARGIERDRVGGRERPGRRRLQLLHAPGRQLRHRHGIRRIGDRGPADVPEMTMRQPIKRGKLMAEINITPFTDVVLVLLIIFMITTPLLVQPGIKVKLPTAKSAENDTSKVITVLIDSSGNLFIGNRAFNLDSLKHELSLRLMNKPDQAVVVKGGKVIQIAENDFYVPAGGFAILYNPTVAHLVDERYQIGDAVEYKVRINTTFTDTADWNDVKVGIGKNIH